MRKIAAALTHSRCWPALLLGVGPSAEHISVLKSLTPDGILDVGANRGQFALASRISLPSTPIVSFEPIPFEAATFRRIHSEDPTITLVEVALGDVDGSTTLHLSNRADSSSLLPIGKRQTELFQTHETGTIAVRTRRLDDLADSVVTGTRLLLKLDIQGFELQALRGAVTTLRRCAYVYVECSEVVLYEGQALRWEISAFLEAHGFVFESRHNCHFHSGSLIQADYLFIRGKL
jgi:FkbM family methyltransferase